MSLSFKEKTKNLLAVSGYIAAGGISSLLILFLIQKSLSFKSQSAQEYHRHIEVALREIHRLEKGLLTLQLRRSESSQNLKPQIDSVNKAIAELKEIPEFIPEQKRELIKINVDNQESLLASQYGLVDRLQDSDLALTQSCSRITSFKQEVINNQNILGSNITRDRQLLQAINSLLDLSIVYCQSHEPELVTAIESKVSEISRALNRSSFEQEKFLITEFANQSKNILAQTKIQIDVAQQVEFYTVTSKLQKLETEYLNQQWQHLQRINNYRLMSGFLLLLIVIFIAYKVIGNLARTNRSIVKILEGFTKELETKVEERTAQLEDSIHRTETALAQAQNANQAKSRFLANMSHELRTPLNAILGFTQLMTRDTSIGDEQQENLKIINRSGEHLLKLINDILEMSKIEVGQITLNENQFDLHLMLKSIEEMLRLKANAKHLNLCFNIESDVPRIVNTDEGKLRQIIINLLGNALKFTDTGSILLNVRQESNQKSTSEQIEFLFADTYNLYFAVEDTGPGIEPEEIQQLFTPFEQTKVGRVSNEGTGLGLSICHKFVELMGGELKVESKINQGSIFYFQIPLRDQEAVASISSRGNQRGKIIGLENPQQPYRILAVDDVSASRLLLNKLLTAIGFEVLEAGDGQEAIALWQSWRPDLILMDMRMPVLNGYDATKYIKAQPSGSKTIVIALTASAFEEERVEILSAGCDDFMRKPFQEDELLTKIGQYLNVDYLYEESEVDLEQEMLQAELTKASLAVMPEAWRSQLYNAAAQVDNQEIFQLLTEIPEDYQALAQGLADLAEQFRCDKIIDLAQSGD
ncbi:MAG: ATP-binding protein [Cyanobacteria bacterium J06621_12]